MLRVEQALQIILNSVVPLESKVVPLAESFARVLAGDIVAPFSVPLLNNSAMDGFVLRSRDVACATHESPAVLEIVDDIRAGSIGRKIIKPGQAARITTGAPLPEGADAVVMVEDTQCFEKKYVTSQIKKEYVKIFKSAEKAENVRYAGEDLKRGELVLKKGTAVGPSQLGILASIGRGEVRVVRQPRVAILATGDEIIAVGKRLTPGKIYNSNTYALMAAVRRAGGIPKILGIAGDNISDLKRKISRGFDADILLTSGGVSVGNYDFVKGALGDLGVEMLFWKVAMRPGKPLAFGMTKTRGIRSRRVAVFGLPGNPVSSLVSFELFVLPAIRKMSGQVVETSTVEAILDEGVVKKQGLRFFLRARTEWRKGAFHTRTTGPQGSGILKSLACANSLIDLPENKKVVAKGKRVVVRYLH